MTWYAFTPPRRIDTPRLELHAWAVGQGPALKAAIDANLAHLKAWMDWAVHEPSPLDVVEQRVASFAANFEHGPDWGYVISMRGETAIIGTLGLHARLGPNALEIGYWIDERRQHQGIATEAARAVTEAALALPGVERVEIRCDPNNTRSAGVPRRLGFRYVTTLEKNEVTPTGEPRDTMVWEMTRESLEHSRHSETRT